MPALPLIPDEPPPPRRSPGMWIILLGVWGVGLCVWGIYLAIIFVVFVRLLG
jgi:hypothetical protein